MRESKKFILDQKEYFLDKSSNCVNLRDGSEYILSEIALITNITTNDIIYNPHCDGLGGSFSANNLVFEKALTAEMADTDELMIIVQRNVALTGIAGDAVKTYDENSHLLGEILIELKLNNEYLSHILGDKFTAEDIENESEIL